MPDDEPICGEYAVYRYTWPGRDEALICEVHSKMLRGVANAMGLPLQLVPVPLLLHKCQQKVSRGGKDDA